MSLIFFIISVFSLTLAFFVEFQLGFAPCQLCLWQRWPFYLLISLFFIELISKKDLKIMQLAVVSGAIFLAQYHSLVEIGIFKLPENCTTGVDLLKERSINDLVEAFQNSKAVTCGKAPFKVLGLSMTGWNLMLNSALMILGGIYFNRKKVYRIG